VVVVVVLVVVGGVVVTVLVDELLSELVDTVESIVDVGFGLSVDVVESIFFKVDISLAKVLFAGLLILVVKALDEVCTALRDWLADCCGVVIESFSELDLLSEFDELPVVDIV
jgi:hypothetical protein